MTLALDRNNLDRETSPYLLQHRGNPVHWQAWGPAALAAAKAANKPILLSIGYAACHWCHVMAHESFESPETAAVMNQLFVNIKVDREERPDIDGIYQSALALLGEQGGWPLTMFLTPDGEPFWGGTYFPPVPRYGRPAFADILRRVAEVFVDDPQTIEKNRAGLMQGLEQMARPEPKSAPEITPLLLDQVAARLLREVDTLNGGIGQAPKFPQTYILELFWRAHRRGGNSAARDAVILTLDKMSQGGIYDHLGGGYARYSTDAVWLVPHFEKMLYDNALLLDLLCLTYPETRSPLHAARIRETAEWVLREMIAEGGAFAATQDADSEGEEGRFYVWSEEDIDQLLGDDSGFFKAAYDVRSGGNWEGHTILNRTKRPDLLDEAGETRLARQRQTLFQARERRVKPGWDDKVLADWNGLMIAALANAGALFANPGWIAAAERAFHFVCEHMTVDGRLRHSWRNAQAKHAALLDDYANMARAGIALHEATGAVAPLQQAQTWVEILNRHYWDGKAGGYFFTADDAESLITRTRSCADNAVPAGNGTMLAVLARLHHLTGELDFAQRGAALQQAFSGELARNFFPLCTFLNSAELLQNTVQIAIIGRRGDVATDTLLRAVFEASVPNRILLVLPPDTPLPASHPAHGKTQLAGKPTAYVCIGATCSLPITDAIRLQAALAKS